MTLLIKVKGQGFTKVYMGVRNIWHHGDSLVIEWYTIGPGELELTSNGFDTYWVDTIEKMTWL